MKTILRPRNFTIGLVLVIGSIAVLNSCKTPEMIAAKTGAQLWGENCNRCHNAPSPAMYRDAQWEAVGEHMRYRANLTDTEVTKIVEFLKSAN